MKIDRLDRCGNRVEPAEFYANPVNRHARNIFAPNFGNAGCVFVWSASSVVRLFNSINPLCVFWRVRAVILNSIKGEPLLPVCNVVGVKRLERIKPPLAYSNSASSVVMETLVSRICASTHHRSVNSVKRMFGTTGNAFVLNTFFVALCSLFVLPATAGHNVSATKVFSSSNVFCTAIANALPHRPATSFAIPIWSHGNKATKAHTGNVDSESLCSGGWHGASFVGNGMLGLYHGANIQAIQFSGRLFIGD